SAVRAKLFVFVEHNEDRIIRDMVSTNIADLVNRDRHCRRQGGTGTAAKVFPIEELLLPTVRQQAWGAEPSMHDI
ncbi:unnamed protein product, partial [Chrysoparadoxa australica]